MRGQPVLVLQSELGGKPTKPQAACKISTNAFLHTILENRAGHSSHLKLQVRKISTARSRDSL